MRYEDQRRLLGLTWIGWINVLLFQWLGFRLAATVQGRHDTIVGYCVRWRLPLHVWRWPYQVLSVLWAVLWLGLWRIL